MNAHLISYLLRGAYRSLWVFFFWSKNNESVFEGIHLNAFTRLHAFPDIWFYSGFLSYFNILILFHLSIINCYANRLTKTMKHILTEYMVSASLENMNFLTIPIQTCGRLSGTNILNTHSFQLPVPSIIISSVMFLKILRNPFEWKGMLTSEDAHPYTWLSASVNAFPFCFHFWIGSRFLETRVLLLLRVGLSELLLWPGAVRLDQGQRRRPALGDHRWSGRWGREHLAFIAGVWSPTKHRVYYMRNGTGVYAWHCSHNVFMPHNKDKESIYLCNYVNI